MLPDKATVVVVGGGIIGLSSLYHLARKGVRDVVLLERKRIASGTTWHAAGIVGQLRDSTAQTAQCKYTTRLFLELEQETGQATGYKQNGTLHYALSDVRLEQLKRNHTHAGRMGIESHLLSVEALSERWPLLDTTGVLGGFLVPSNGQVNALDVTQALRIGARQRGAQVFEQTRVTGLATKHGRVIGVETDNGTIATDKVLLAGGMWTQAFAKRHGVTVPLHAAEHTYVVTEPIAGLPSDLPVLVGAEDRLYFKEDAGKLLIGAFEARGKAWGQNGIPESFEFDELPYDLEHNQDILNTMLGRIPALNDVGVRTFFCGPESFTPDGRPIMGPAPELDGLWIAAGMNSNGILLSGGVGQTMADWIVDGEASSSMGSVLTARSHFFQCNQRYLAERVTESTGLHYGLAWPGRQIETARGIRRVPLHAQLKTVGAKFAEKSGWEVPMYFDLANNAWPVDPSIGRQAWAPQVEAECLAAQESAVLLDQSMYAKIIVQGPDAARALGRVCGANLSVPIGTSVYTQFLNQRGGIEADVTVTRLRPTQYLVLTGHPSQTRDQAWIRKHADSGWQFEIFDATSGFALLTLHGPESRAILQRLSDEDLSADTFAFGTAREIDVAYARAWAIRRSFLGELGYELLMPTEFCAQVYEQIVRAGENHGLRHCGLFAMNHCRMEKGFRHFGHDIGEDDTPYETGLGFAVDLDRPENFLGKEVLKAHTADGPTTKDRTVSIAVRTSDPTRGPFLIHNEVIRKNGAIVGHVTSGAWGYRTGRSLGLASLHRASGVSESWIDDGGFTVVVAGESYAIDVQLGPFYDPTGERMRR